MIRNLKTLIAAAMALVALGAISASDAQAAEFHCSVEPCTITVKPDGTPGPTGKTAHQVFIVRQGGVSVSTTCEQLTGHGTSATKTFNTFTLTKIIYHECNVAGEKPTTVRMNGCQYHFAIGGVHDATAEIRCLGSEKIEIEVPATGCLIMVGSTGVLAGGLTFKDAETNGVKKTEITAEVTVTNISGEVNNKCPGGLKEGAITGEYTTGNVELTAEEDEAPFTHLKLWWE